MLYKDATPLQKALQERNDAVDIAQQAVAMHRMEKRDRMRAERILAHYVAPDGTCKPCSGTGKSVLGSMCQGCKGRGRWEVENAEPN